MQRSSSCCLAATFRKRLFWQQATLALLFFVGFFFWFPPENNLQRSVPGSAGHAAGAGYDDEGGVAATVGDEVITNLRVDVLLGQGSWRRAKTYTG